MPITSFMPDVPSTIENPFGFEPDGQPEVVQQANSLLGRFGKQIYTGAVARPIKETLYGLGGGKILSYGAAYLLANKLRSQGITPPKIRDLQKQIKAGVIKKMPGLPVPEIAPPETWQEKGIDLAAGVAAMVAQLAVLRKAAPPGTSEPVIWEMQNLMTGGTPGKGALFGATVGIAGKLGTTQFEKAVAESAGMYVANRLTGAEPVEATAMAAVPAILRGGKAAYKAIRKPVGKEALQQDLSLGITEPTKSIPKLPPELQPIKQDLVTQLKGIRRLNKTEIASMEHRVRGERVAAYENFKNELITQGVNPIEASARATSRLKGAFDIPSFEPPKLTPTAWTAIGRRIEEFFKPFRESYEKLRAHSAVEKLQQGVHLQNNEIDLLEQILGSDFAAEMRRLQPSSSRIHRVFRDIMWFLKMPTSYDVQMRRQARWIRGRHPILYIRSIGKNVQGYWSQKQTNKILADLETDPYYHQAADNGSVMLSGTEGTSRAADMFRSRIARLPGIKSSQRGFYAGFDWLQTQLYRLKVTQWERSGKPITDKMLADLTDFNNTILGMYKPKSFRVRAAQDVLSDVIWSPTLTYSRIRTPSMILTNPTMRWEVAATLSSYIGSGLAMYYAAKLGKHFIAGEKLDLRPHGYSTDFGKAIIGNTRFDMFGDGGPYIRALLQFLSGKKESEAGRTYEQPRMDAIWRFARSKRQPLIDLIWSVVTSKDYAGKPLWKLPESADKWSTAQKIAFLGGKQLVNRLFPFFVQGTIQAAYNDGWPTGLLAGAEEFFSGSTVSYKPSKNTELANLRNIAADFTYGKEWDELGPIEQQQLNITFAQDFQKKEQEINKEQAQKETNIDRIIKQERKAGQKVLKQLQKPYQTLLTNAGVQIGLSRTIGPEPGWYLNDARFKQYQDSTAQILNDMMSRFANLPVGKEDLQPELQTNIMQELINTAKQIAAQQIIAQNIKAP